MPNYVRDVCSSAWQLLSLKHVVMCTALNWNELKTNKCIGYDMKGADHRSPNCIRKTKKYVLWNVNICPLLQFCETFSPGKISLKSGNRMLSYGQKQFLIWQPSTILNFKKIIFGHVTVIEFQICCCVSSFIRILNPMIFRWDMAISQFLWNSGSPPYWILEVQ